MKNMPETRDKTLMLEVSCNINTKARAINNRAALLIVTLNRASIRAKSLVGIITRKKEVMLNL